MWLTSINSDTSCRFPVYLETSLLICNAIQLPGFYMKKQKRKTKRGSQRDYSYQRTYFSLYPYIKNYYRNLHYSITPHEVYKDSYLAAIFLCFVQKMLRSTLSRLLKLSGPQIQNVCT